MTGDPNRVVRHGYRWSDGKIFEFSFDSLVFPACTRCNELFSAFEDHAKTVVESLCRKEPITSENYVFLLDWLDKVRIGLWLGYRYLQQNPHPGWRQLFLSDATSISFGSFPLLSGPPSVSLA